MYKTNINIRKVAIDMKRRSQCGITLVALVVMIMILLILAGVSINLVLGQNGLITQAKEAKRKTGETTNQELSEIEFAQAQIEIESQTDYKNNVNRPNLKVGMTPIYFVQNGNNYEVKTTNNSDSNWYDYDEKNWANTQTEDGSMWVWIPRFAYKLNNDNKTFDVKFLIGTTDYFYNDKGKLQKATRATADSSPDTTKEYAVHPAFANESDMGFRDGGWDSELTGIWVAKFEAGYADIGSQQESTENYTQNISNIYGSYNTSTKMTYPLFQGLKISYNYISNGDAYTLCKAMKNTGNIYGLANDTDSHLMKNSEWGACSYLGQSQYGLNGINIYVNNVNINESTAKGNAVTGVCGINEAENTYDASSNPTITLDNIKSENANNVKLWNTMAGIKASSSGTVYGIYDLSGGLWERTATYIANNNESLEYGKSFTNYTKQTTNYNVKSSKYYTVYQSKNSEENDYTTASVNNWKYNKALSIKIFGDAVLEVSTNGKGSTSYYNDYSNFPAMYNPFFYRGGMWADGSATGVFAFACTNGNPLSYNGFRAVLI